MAVEGVRVDELKAEGTGKEIPANFLHFKISDMMNILLLSSISWQKSFRAGKSVLPTPSPQHTSSFAEAFMGSTGPGQEVLGW